MELSCSRALTSEWCYVLAPPPPTAAQDFSETMIRSWPSGHSSSSAAGLLFLTHVLWCDLLALLEVRDRAPGQRVLAAPPVPPSLFSSSAESVPYGAACAAARRAFQGTAWHLYPWYIAAKAGKACLLGGLVTRHSSKSSPHSGLLIGPD